MATAYMRADIDSMPEAHGLPRRLDLVLTNGVLLTLAFGVLAIGAVLPSAMFVLRTCAIVLFLVWAVAQLVQGKLIVVPSPLYAPALAFAGLIVVQIVLPISAYRHDTLVELLNYACYGLLAFVMLQTASNHCAKLLSYCFTIFGLIISLFALLQYFTSNGKLYWTIQIPRDALFFGPYVNHNHYAGLMEMLIAFPLVSALQTRLRLATRCFFAFSAVIMGVSVFESASRGGVISLICQIVLLACIGRFTRMKRGAAIMLLLVLVSMAVLLAVVADSDVASRISTLRDPGRADVAGWRMQLNRDSFVMFRARPILGWGLGAFPSVYPQFRSFYDDAPVLQAHNDYMQLLVETGIAGAVIVIWFLFVTFREGWRNLTKTQNPWDRGVTVAAIVSVSGILVHSVSDFNLHIPANAAIFFVMCALVATASGREIARPGNRETRNVTPIDAGEADAALEEFPSKLRVIVRRF